MADVGIARKLDQGTGYGRPPQHIDDELVRVGPGTPCGELMRRYWHPIALAEQATTRPRKIRILGEDLILFRDRKGRPGLLYPRCMHRGTTLFYGKVEDEGIRCCYHGWLFAADGTCLDQPCEPEHGLHRDIARQPWYPVEERYGLVFAYLGPAEKKPILPRYDILEELEPGQSILARQMGAQTGDGTMPVAPYSWVHLNDNVIDPYHVYVLHSTFSNVQFSHQFIVKPHKVDFFQSDCGICYSAVRDMGDGRLLDRVSSFIMPCIMSVPDTRGDLQHRRSSRIGWIVPMDDESFTTFSAGTIDKGEKALYQPLDFNGKTWAQMTEAEHQETPGDYEAQSGQGTISLHSEEHLAQSDRGIVMMRRLLKEQMKLVAQGGDPINVAYDLSKATIKVPSGNFFRKAEAAE
jgi:phenylpropionate dioxygenase-like ring-hydroxylating dioxygenase large terminal subunit